MPTRILQITFKLRAPVPEYRSLCQLLAPAFAALPGLRWKIWVLNEREKEAGGFYVFESEEALNEFLSSALAAQVKSHPALYDFEATVFDVMVEVTAMTRGPATTAAWKVLA